MSKYIPGEGVMEFLMSDKHKFEPLMDGEQAIIQPEFCGTVRSEVVKGPLCRDCGLTEEMHTEVLAKLMTLPAAADSRQPCEDGHVVGVLTDDNATRIGFTGGRKGGRTAAAHAQMHAVVESGGVVYGHDPATCWWCQRGLKLVECSQDGSHV